MRIRLVAVGTRMPGWVGQGFAEYAARLPRECALELVEIRPVTAATPQEIKRREGEHILRAVPADHHVVALDRNGMAWDTADLAGALSRWMQAGRDLALLVGGAEGLDEACLARADERWSLSRLTLPHRLVRVIVAEQIYRAQSVNRGHPYHRA